MIRFFSPFIRNIIIKLFRPIYYSYTGYEIINLFKRLNRYKREKKIFFKYLGYFPDLKNPRSFNEKILWKKIYDRDPLLPIVSDKYMVRKYLKDILGENDAKKILIPLFHATNRPETIPFEDLEEEYVIKPNHSWNRLIFAENFDGQKRYTIIDHKKTTILFDCMKTRNKIIILIKNFKLIYPPLQNEQKCRFIFSASDLDTSIISFEHLLNPVQFFFT